MPVQSKKQFKFMKAIEEGYIKKPGLTPEKAYEFTEGMTKERLKKLKEKLGKK